MIITSCQNSLIKDTKKLKEKKYRKERKQFLVEGFRFVEEALKSTFLVPYIFVEEAQMEKWENSSLKNYLKDENKIYFVNKKVLKEISNTENSQGIIAIVNNKKITMKNSEGFYLLVDKVQDPGNMGTLIRTAHASGALGVLITKGTVDIYNDKTLRSTMGSIFNIPIIEDDDLLEVANLKNKGFKLISSSLDTDRNFYSLNLQGKFIITVGNEGNGVSNEVMDISDIITKIPMPGNSESLNVSIAAAVMMFEYVRQNI